MISHGLDSSPSSASSIRLSSEDLLVEATVKYDVFQTGIIVMCASLPPLSN